MDVSTDHGYVPINPGKDPMETIPALDSFQFLFAGIGMPGMTELVVILVIVMIFFGVGKLPKVLGEMGKGVKAFKDGVNEGKSASEIEINATTEVVSEAEEVRTGA